MYQRAEASLPVRVAVVNDFELVVAGVAGILAAHPDRVSVVQCGGLPVEEVDVVLFDAYAQRGDAWTRLADVVDTLSYDVVVYSFSDSGMDAAAALAAGASGWVAKQATGDRLADAILRVAAGETVVLRAWDDDARVGEPFPGAAAGLTARESEVLALTVRGLRNQEVADAAFISLYTVKSHLRNVYSKVGARNRGEAILWALRHGFGPTGSEGADARATIEHGLPMDDPA
ncbi:helix-turn-helix transcriptional regulator [Nocardioides acrostichi]|uniref:Response regulator transcription factor n=1 Tax=Nocardioides acrostichi TaxID=2784339 RepID=A0A930UXV2_9ACTN|nr:response regulator transcription factor [Nocardioides acrostichi]MBF4160261.1 response regulator transcription factor [Nocardioides acrostichi]